MRHRFLDHHSQQDSAVHRLDPRSKLLSALLLLFLVSASGRITPILLCFGIFLSAMGLSRLPVLHFVKKLLIVLPFMVVLGLLFFISFRWQAPALAAQVFFAQPLGQQFLLLSLKSAVAILLLSLLTSVTSVRDLLWAMRRFKIPRIITTLSNLVYAYLFILIDETHRTLRAKKSRSCGKTVQPIQTFAHLTATIFLRSLARADAIYKAMLARGFNGEFPDTRVRKLRPSDGLALLITLLIFTFGVLWTR